MSFEVFYTQEAEQDLVDIWQYIVFNLRSPETAQKQTGRILTAIASLDEMPGRFKLYHSEPWRSKGIRSFPVDNYLVIYMLMEAEKKVAILRIMYGGRDIDRQLSQLNISQT